MSQIRPYFVLFALLVAAPVWAGPAEDGWWTDYSKARQAAIEGDIPLVIYFTGSDWCVWCRKLDAGLFSTEEFNTALNNRIIGVKVDFPKRRKVPVQTARMNRVLKERFEVEAFPTVLWLDPTDERILRRHGYVDSK